MTGSPGTPFRLPRPPAAPVPAPPPRDTRLDILRGWLQLTIFVSHASTAWIYGWLVYGAWGLSDSSEQFVFLSGYVLGSVFARRTAMQGRPAAALDMLRRAARLYRRHLVVFALFGAMIFAADRSGWLPGEIDRLGWTVVVRDPVHAIPGALAMLSLPKFMDILPLFIGCMLLLPAFAAVERAVGGFAMLAPLALYAAVWRFGLKPPDIDGTGGAGFNPFAWQLLFLFGACLGRRALLTGRPLPASRWATALALSVVLAGVAVRLAWSGVLAWPAPPPASPMFDKQNLAPPLIAHALALTWLVSRLVPPQAAWMASPPLRWLAAAGRQSLKVFCVGLFLSWGADTLLRMSPARWSEPLVMAAGMAILLLYAWQADRGWQAHRGRQADRGRQTDRDRQADRGRQADRQRPA